jgi:hypothetical protein
METTMTPSPLWFRATASAGLIWNAYGTLQFAQSLTATPESLIASGLTAAQAQVMTTHPVWMTLAFALGVLGGLVGSGLLLWRHRAALPVLAASLAGYVVLYLGDITQGVFAAMGAPQVIILTLVVAIAIGLLALAARAKTTALIA